MTEKTIIFGKRSNLSKHLHTVLNDSIIISSQEVYKGEFSFTQFSLCDSINIIINAFYPASKFEDFKNPKEFIQSSIYLLSLILEQIKSDNIKHKIKKIIYTSSASVYGNNNYCCEYNKLIAINFPASLKIASEKLIEQFCKDLDIDYTICRIFNMYGGDDNFSVISKIVKVFKEKKQITLINSGTSIRDFIHVNDVVKSYLKILEIKHIPVINIATGKGVSVKMILDLLQLHGFNIEYKNIERNEIKLSTANVSRLSKLVNVENFQEVLPFIESELKESILQ